MKKLFFVLSFFILSFVSYTQTIPVSKGFVTDYENLFTPEQNAELTKILTDYEAQTTIEIAVLTVKDFDSDIADFAQKTAEKWGVGKKGKDNGLLIIISKNKRILRTETGYGLEGYLPDGWLKLQGDSIVEKYFKNSIVSTTKKDTIEILNKVNDVLNTGKNFLDKNVTDPDLRKALSDVDILKKDSIKKSQILDTNARYFNGTKALVIACMNRIGKEGYSEETNKNLIKENEKNKEEESLISWALRVIPWWGWVIIIGIWIIIFIIDPGLALQILFLGMAGKGGSGGGGFGGGKFGGGGSSSRW
jgi:uncharacterized protein